MSNLGIGARGELEPHFGATTGCLVGADPATEGVHGAAMFRADRAFDPELTRLNSVRHPFGALPDADAVVGHRHPPSVWDLLAECTRGRTGPSDFKAL